MMVVFEYTLPPPSSFRHFPLASEVVTSPSVFGHSDGPQPGQSESSPGIFSTGALFFSNTGVLRIQ